MYQDFLPFKDMYTYNIPLCIYIYHTLLICLSVKGHLSCFYLWAMNMGIKMPI